MWIFTKKGFVSAVHHKDNPAMMVVRARDRSHLEALFPGYPIINIDFADYPHRIEITKISFIDWTAQQAEAIDYPDFKSSLTDQKYKAVCSEIWSVAHRLEMPDPTVMVKAAGISAAEAAESAQRFGEALAGKHNKP